MKFLRSVFPAAVLIVLMYQPAGIYAQDEAETVLITSDPAGAEVIVDGTKAGAAPVEVSLTPGSHRITLILPKYKPYEDTYEITHQTTSIHVPLKRAVASVHMETEPAGGTVFIDGIPFGETPLDVKLYHGSHIVRYERHPYKPHELRFDVSADDSLMLHFRDFAVPAVFNIHRDPAMPVPEEVYINGVPLGETPVTDASVYSEQAVVRIGGREETITVQPGYRYDIRPTNRIPLITIEDMTRAADIEAPPDKPEPLPEYRIKKPGSLRVSLDSKTFFRGLALSGIVSGGISIMSYNIRKSYADAAKAGTAAFGFGITGGISASVCITRDLDTRRIPIKRNRKKNVLAVEAWKAEADGINDRNRTLIDAENLKLSELNTARGTWEITESAEQSAAETQDPD